MYQKSRLSLSACHQLGTSQAAQEASFFPSQIGSRFFQAV